jgi:dTDP-4-dehydrorhamnose 3,5-epimerase
MRFVPLDLNGPYLIELDRHEDDRGFFARTWCREEFAEHGLDPKVAQCSLSRNTHAGTLRGMHFQRYPHAETKVVRCTRGAIFDVIIDLRETSSSRGRWFGAILDAEQGTALYIPHGFAHGFQSLVDDSDVLYLISEPYAPASSDGVRWDDPAFGIEWPEAVRRTISSRDDAWPDFAAEGQWIPADVS